VLDQNVLDFDLICSKLRNKETIMKSKEVRIEDFKEYVISQRIMARIEKDMNISVSCLISPYSGSFVFELWDNHKLAGTYKSFEQAINNFNERVQNN